MKKCMYSLMALLMAGLLFGCSAGGEDKRVLSDERMVDQLAVRMVLKEFSEQDQADVEVYAKEIAEMSDSEFDAFMNEMVQATDRNTDWNILKRNFARLGVEMELPEMPEDGGNFILESFSAKRDGQSLRHLYLHLYSTWYESQAASTDVITFYFDAEKLEYVSSYSSDEIVTLSDQSRYDAGEIIFDYNDFYATDPVPFDGDDRFGEVTVGLRVKPLATDENTTVSGTLFHTRGEESMEVTVEDTLALP